MAGGEGLEAFALSAVAQVAAEHFLDERGQALEGDAGEDLPAHGLVCAKAAADENVVAVLALARDFRLRAEQADVAHVVLRAGVRAAGDVDVHRPVEMDALVEVVGELERVPLRVGLREFAV